MTYACASTDTLSGGKVLLDLPVAMGRYCWTQRHVAPAARPYTDVTYVIYVSHVTYVTYVSYVTSPRLTDPCAQTLSYTDGITDDLPAICDVLEAENSKRAAASQPQVVLINDSCLAFCVLVHNDGRDGKPSMRALDLTEGAC